MSKLQIDPVRRIEGQISIPGDKSISHRAAILGLLAQGETLITNFLTAEDCQHTLRACQQLGARVEQQGTMVKIRGCGLHGLLRPSQTLDCGNSGTGVRLLAGVLAAQPFDSVITGDEQVRRRPMRRVIEPLQKMGAQIKSQTGQLCPLTIHGKPLQAMEYSSPVASAQVKSCLLLAGLFTPGETKVILPAPARDHMERMLKYFGADIQHEFLSVRGTAHWDDATGEWASVRGGRELLGKPVVIPSDISSAAFFMVAASLLPGSDLLIENIGINPTRTGVLELLLKMGADITLENQRELSGEPVADIRVRGRGKLKGRSISGQNLIPRLIDELPILAIAAAVAEGETVIEDAAELRVKETDRIGVLAREMHKIGIEVKELPDGLVIQGGEIRGGEVDSHGDHRLAMSMAIAGLVSEQGIMVGNVDCVSTSFPGFWQLLKEVCR